MEVSGMWIVLAFMLSLCVAGGFSATIRVPGDYPTLDEAIAVSRPGDVIEIGSGYHKVKGILWIDHDLVLRGVGHPVVQGLLVTFVDGSFVLQGFELRGLVGVSATAQFLVEDCRIEEIGIIGGRVEFHGTEVDNLSVKEGASVARTSAVRTVQILGGSVSFQGCELGELWLSAGGELTLIDSEVTGHVNALGGSLALSVVNLRGPVSLTGDAGMVAEDCTFHSGITLKQEGQAVLRRVSVSGGDKAGITLEDEATASLYDVTVSGLNTCAIFAADEARLLLKNCTISWCAEGLHLTGTSRAEVRESRFAHNALYGISAWGKSYVEGKDNEFVCNGCDLLGNVAPTVRVPLVKARYRELVFPSPEFSSLQQAVDALLPGGMLRISPGDYIETVTITKEITILGPGARLFPPSPELPCISVVPGTKVEVRGLTVTGGRRGIFSAGEIELEKVAILSNSIGIELVAKAVARLRDCRVEDNEVGVQLHPGTAAGIAGSHIAGNSEAGIFLKDGTSLELVSSKVEGNGKGISLYLKECGYPWGLSRPDVEVRGSGNVVRGNLTCDLCPPYPGPPWPEGFLAEG